MKHFFSFLFSLACLAAAIPTSAQESWPKDIPLKNGGKITMYEPQPESVTDQVMTGRAAVSVREKANAEPVFGAIFFSATLRGNGNTRASFEALEITQAKFSGIEDESRVDEYSSLIEQNADGWSTGRTMNELAEAARIESGHGSEAFNNAAPAILYRNTPTTLVVLDGEPRVLRDENLDADKVANSPYLIFKEGKKWNLYAGGNWYQSNDVKGKWKHTTRLSSKMKSVNEAIKKQEAENNKNGEAIAEPRVTDIVVVTTPTELLQTDGDADYKTVAGTSLLYVANSPNQIFKDINSQKTYILIAGRWYHANGMNGPWQYIAADQLPEDFAQIPEGSDKDEVLANVAGTDAAAEARLDAEIPQTAKVDRRTATIDVTYDGEPYFAPVSGTSLDLAENSNVTVMRDASGNYFALDNGIWFISTRPDGPWSVANDRPRDIDDIPANSPAYHTKYVHVYDYSPDYVWMGYTSGYLGSYHYGPTIVYGTGFSYRPWFRRVYYPRPITWGFGFMYDPWFGWNMNWGYNFGYMYVGYHHGYAYGPSYGYGYGGGWFGPSRYCPAYRRPYWNGGYYGRNRQYDYYGSAYRQRQDFNQNNGTGSRPARNVNAGGRYGWAPNNNIYNNQAGVTTRDISRTARVTRPNGVSRTNVNGTSPLSGRYNNRLNNNSTRPGTVSPGSVPSNAATDRSNNNNNNSRPQLNDDRRTPTVRQPANSGTTNGSVSDYRPGRNTTINRNPSANRDQPVTNNNENGTRDLPNVTTSERNNRPVLTSPSRGERPAITRPATSERPAATRPQPEIQRPSSSERPSSPVQRPAASERPVSPVQRQAPVERRAAPIQRPSVSERPSVNRSQSQRPSVSERPSPAQRPSVSNRPSGGVSRGNNSENGSRPSRR